MTDYYVFQNRAGLTAGLRVEFLLSTKDHKLARDVEENDQIASNKAILEALDKEQRRILSMLNPLEVTSNAIAAFLHGRDLGRVQGKLFFNHMLMPTTTHWAATQTC